MKPLVVFFALIQASAGFSQHSSDSSWRDSIFVCYFKCDNGSEFLRHNCKFDQVNNLILNSNSSAPVDIYEEFEDIIATLKQDDGNPFPLDYIFRACDAVCNAAAVRKDSFNLIFFKPSFISGLSLNIERKRWAIRGVLAHEVGHHLLGHTRVEGLTADERRKQELRADYFAGFVISKFPGSSEQMALESLYLLDSPTYKPANDFEELTHNYPTFAHRRTAVVEGYFEIPGMPKRIAMFADIQKLALAHPNGPSIILKSIDKNIAYMDYRKASKKLDELSSMALTPDERVAVDKLKRILEDKEDKVKDGRGGDAKIPPSNDDLRIDDIDVDPDRLTPQDIDRLKDLYHKYELYKDGTSVDKAKAAQILKEIRTLEAKQKS